MAKAYCKSVPPVLSCCRYLLTICQRWPVIVAIAIAGLIVLSVLWCIIRCACCGMSCCCTCFSFLKCCDCCGGCCDGRKNRPHKHLDDPDPYNPQQGYQPTAPMMGGGLGGKSSYDPPQFAQFEVGKSGFAVSPGLNEDALPPMPSWETASKKHVPSEEEKDGVELGELDPVTGQRLPLMAGAAGTGISSPPTPVNEFTAGPFGAGAGPGLGRNGHPGDEDPYGENQNTFNQNGGGYRGTPSPGPGMGMGLGMGGRGYGPGQNGMDSYGHPSSRGPSPGPNNGFADAAVGGYGRGRGQYPNERRQFPPQPARQYSSDSARPLNPGRQYSDRSYQQDGFQQNGPPRGPGRAPRSPPLVNNSGFDFGMDHQQQSSRPSPPPQQPSYRSAPGRSYSPSPNFQQRGAGGYPGSTAPPSYASRSPPPQEQSYQSYVPSSEQRMRGSPQPSMVSAGRAREPQNWDPVQR
jgi:hypothetical protein